MSPPRGIPAGHVRVGTASRTWQTRRRVPTESGGFTTVPDGEQHDEIEVYVDLDELMRSTAAARASYRGRSTMAGGAIILVRKEA